MDKEPRKMVVEARIYFIISGAAIGLGAIWKFPYVTGSGGGAFFLLFIIFTIAIGFLMLISEFIIGRGSGKEAISADKKLAPDSLWVNIGRLGVVGCFLLLSFYCVVGGWVGFYLSLAFALQVMGKIIQGVRNYPGAIFGLVTGSPAVTLFGLAIFLLINIVVIASLESKMGIEKANKYMMPLFYLSFLSSLLFDHLTLDGAMEGVKFFLHPDFSEITSEAVLDALGQSFFALAVGFSCMVTYSSYLEKDVSIPASAGSVVMMNIFVSLFAGLAIFPAAFSFGLEPTDRTWPALYCFTDSIFPNAFRRDIFKFIFNPIFVCNPYIFIQLIRNHCCSLHRKWEAFP